MEPLGSARSRPVSEICRFCLVFVQETTYFAHWLAVSKARCSSYKISMYSTLYNDNFSLHEGLRAEDVERGAVHRGCARAAADAPLEGDHLRPRPPRLRRQGPTGTHPPRRRPQEGTPGLWLGLGTTLVCKQWGILPTN